MNEADREVIKGEVDRINWLRNELRLIDNGEHEYITPLPYPYSNYVIDGINNELEILYQVIGHIFVGDEDV